MPSARDFFCRIFYYNCNNNFVNYLLFIFFLFVSVLPTSLHRIFSYSVSTLITSQANIRLTALFIQKMTCCPVSRLVFFERPASPCCSASGRIWTSGMETASTWRIHRAWNIALKDDSLSRFWLSLGSGTGTAESSVWVYGWIGWRFSS